MKKTITMRAAFSVARRRFEAGLRQAERDLVAGMIAVDNGEGRHPNWWAGYERGIDVLVAAAGFANLQAYVRHVVPSRAAVR